MAGDLDESSPVASERDYAAGACLEKQLRWSARATAYHFALVDAQIGAELTQCAEEDAADLDGLS